MGRAKKKQKKKKGDVSSGNEVRRNRRVVSEGTRAGAEEILTERELVDDVPENENAMGSMITPPDVDTHNEEGSEQMAQAEQNEEGSGRRR